jgi:erythronate-4-phosphate dehydrogenase
MEEMQFRINTFFITLPIQNYNMIRILADDKIPFLKGVLERFCEIKYIPGNKINHEMVKQADALLIRTRTKCSSELLEDTPVQFIGTATIGFDHIDTHFCEKNNIKWINAPGCNSFSVQQYIASALAKISNESGFDPRDKTIGILGVGNVGSKVEALARVLGMNIILCDPPRARREGKAHFSLLGNLLRESDIITLHVPLNIVGEDITYHLFNEKTFRKMKKGAWFINTSRGEVVDTNSLKAVLKSGKFSGAVIDVWENEPDIDSDLLSSAYFATPHIAGYSADGKANGTAIVVNALCRFFNLTEKSWYPENVPEPISSLIAIDGSGKTDNEIIGEAILHTYNIENDDIKLRFSPDGFEKQRGDYPLRREFPSYTVNIKSGSQVITTKLEKLGFKVQTDPVI